MSVLKLSARAALVALAMLAASAEAAWAETIYLKCTGNGNSDTLTVNITKSMVNNYPATINENGH
jgi:hypothetical protein